MRTATRVRILTLAVLASGLFAAVQVLPGRHSVNAQTTSVAIQNFKFTPDPITVTVGSTVTWTNSDTAPHTATANDGSFDTGTLSTGQSGSITFSTAGSFSYICTIHPFMKGTVNVVAGPTGAAQPAQATPAAATPAGSAGATGLTLQLAAGANLIGVPSGTALSGATTYAYSSLSNNYTQLGPSDALQGGQGYWAELPAPATLTLPAGSNAPVSITASANAWQLIGDPSGTQPAVVSGADGVYTYNPQTNSYTSTTTLNPGQGAWAITARGGTISITPGSGSAATATPAAGGTPAASATAAAGGTAVPAATATPGAAATAIATPAH